MNLQLLSNCAPHFLFLTKALNNLKFTLPIPEYKQIIRIFVDPYLRELLIRNKKDQMETVENKYITVAYKLYTMEDGEKELFEEAKAEHPFQFISGLGTTLEDFENQITALSKGDKFDFTIPADKAYGQYDEQHVIDLPKNIFEIDGKFDSERIKEGNIGFCICHSCSFEYRSIPQNDFGSNVICKETPLLLPIAQKSFSFRLCQIRCVEHILLFLAS